MPADERAAARETKVAPKVDAFFGYIHSMEDSDRMKKAITYAINQEQNLRRFLKRGLFGLF